MRTVADLFAYERKANPDSHVKYGPLGLSKECKASLSADLPPGLSPYKGMVDCHPYGSVTQGKATYVADAGANVIFTVTKSGHVSTLTVLPLATFRITAGLAKDVGLPDCAVGHMFALESVLTDVEVGRDGVLYVSTLPGGPEGGSLGNMGSVYRVDPWNGNVTLVATGFAGATGVAIGHHGTIYVAELYANLVSTIDRRGHVRPFIRLNQPAAVGYCGGKPFVSTGHQRRSEIRVTGSPQVGHCRESTVWSVKV